MASRQLERVEDSLVPERGPSLVHDLGLDLWNEVLRFLVDDGEEVAFPVGEERVVVPDEEKDVLLGRGRGALEVDIRLLDAPVNPLEGIGRTGGSVGEPRPLVLRGQLTHGEIAPALQ